MIRKSDPLPLKNLSRDVALEYLLVGDLRELLDEPMSRENTEWLIAVLDELLRLLPREFRAEEAGGYLQEVLDEYPGWERQVEELRREHKLLYRRLFALRHQIGRGVRDGAVAEGLRKDLQDWVEALESHNHRETDILMEAINLEVGVGD